ncbi:MAG: hypothetical protein DRI65_03075 [Chloroflexota bacterium]|nr:MAG: hypothetical protein DRI65_03075 [Chloroflexota bacterium]
MNKKETRFPRWIFAVLAIGSLLASGIFLGILSAEGVSTARVLQAAGFGLVGLLMFWGGYNNQ